MAVDLSLVFDEKVREFSVRGDSTRFSSDYTTAARRVIRTLQIHNGQNTILEAVTGTATIIESLDEQYTFVVAAGITFYMMQLGQKPKDGRSREMAKEEWLDAEGDYLMGIVGTNSRTDSNDIVGLGAIGRDEA